MFNLNCVEIDKDKSLSEAQNKVRFLSKPRGP